MEGFREFLADIKQFPALFAFLMTPPLTNLFLPIGPPEEAVWITFATALFAAGTLMLVYLASKKKGAVAVRTARLWIVAGMVLVLLYLFVFFLFVYQVPRHDGGTKRVAIGFVYLSPEVKQVAESFPSTSEALLASDGDPYTIYTATSIAIIRMLLIVLWLSCFSAGYGAIAFFIRAISSTNPKPAAPKPAPVPPNPTPAPNSNPAPQNPAPAQPNPAQPKKPKKKPKPDAT